MVKATCDFPSTSTLASGESQLKARVRFRRTLGRPRVLIAGHCRHVLIYLEPDLPVPAPVSGLGARGRFRHVG